LLYFDLFLFVHGRSLFCNNVKRTTSQVNNLLGSPLISASKVYPAGNVAGAVTCTSNGNSFLTARYGVSDVMMMIIIYYYLLAFDLDLDLDLDLD
jgi:hypothetical protein